MLNFSTTQEPLSHQWAYALIGGLIALPFTAIGYWQTGSELTLSPVFLGGLLAGYLAHRRNDVSRGIGIRTGLIGGLSLIWMLFDILTAAVGVAGPSWFVAAATILTVAFTAVIAILGFGLAALIGEAGARVGSWVAGRGPEQATTAANL